MNPPFSTPSGANAAVATNPASDASMSTACVTRRALPGSPRLSQRFQTPVMVFTPKSTPIPPALVELVAHEVLAHEERDRRVAGGLMNGEPPVVPLAVLDGAAALCRDAVRLFLTRLPTRSERRGPDRDASERESGSAAHALGVHDDVRRIVAAGGRERIEARTGGLRKDCERRHC